jgi:YHS domain-containing protein
MRLVATLVSGGLLIAASSAFAGEFGDHCAWGLANGKKVKTDCSINATGPDGKTYCFGSETGKWEFAADPEKYIKAAADNYK